MLVVLAAATLTGAGASAITAVSGDIEQSATLAGRIDPSQPKNVVLLVGDGMGDSEVTLARYYGKGAAGRLNMDRLPFRGNSIHYVLRAGPGPNYQPNYVGDSAPTATTAWSTGKRTQDNRLSQGPSSADNVPGSNAGYPTYLEIARAAGKATGDVTTAELTDATPAAPSAHISQRACHGPADTRPTCPLEAKTAATPGLGSIAEQQVDEGFDVYRGGGRARFQQTLTAAVPTTVVDYAQSKGYAVVNDKAGLDAVTSLAGGAKMLGLFNASTMTTEFKPLFARTDAFLSAPCVDPTVNLLDDDPDGFTLQVEGASIDKRDHAADVCGQIGETLAFDDAIGVALEFQRTHTSTLIVVTADHAHSSQLIGATSKPATGSTTRRCIPSTARRFASPTGRRTPAPARPPAARSRTPAPRSRSGRPARRRRTSRGRSIRPTSSPSEHRGRVWLARSRRASRRGRSSRVGRYGGRRRQQRRAWSTGTGRVRRRRRLRRHAGTRRARRHRRA